LSGLPLQGANVAPGDSPAAGSGSAGRSLASSGVVLACAWTSWLVLTAAAAAADVAHPVYRVTGTPERVAELERIVAPVMALSEAELIGLIPDRTGFRFMGCPNCSGGAQEQQLEWSLADPRHVRCRYCQMVFPNDKYPEDRELNVTNPLGHQVSYPYWEGKDGYRLFFSAKGWREARVYFAARAQDLGTLYQLTGDRRYARRVALMLETFARHYPGYLVSRDWPHQPKGFATEPPYPTGGGKWGRWCYEEIPNDLVYAYDSVCSSGELERLATELGVDVKGRIENDFFRGAIRQDQFHGPMYTNASPYTYEGYAIVGRVLGEPAYVHESVRRTRELIGRQFYFDGFWFEGAAGYHQWTLEDLDRVFVALKGYTDPPGYRDPQDGTRFDDLDVSREIPLLKRANAIFEVFRYPDGRLLPVHDSGAIFRRYAGLPPLERSDCRLFPGVGHAWLGRGTGPNQTQFHLHFSGAYGHHHADNLNIALFAHGEELLSDLGYSHSKHRSWTASTLAHNTVLINEQEQYTRGDHGPSDGRLRAWETSHPIVQWVEAGAESAYPGVASLYQRAAFLISAGNEKSYVVDLFRVEGGRQHDWALHGSADRDVVASVNRPLTPLPGGLLNGIDVRLPQNERDPGDAAGRNWHFGYVRNAAAGRATEGTQVTFKPATGDGPGLLCHLLASDRAELIVGDIPTVRRAEENDALVDQFRTPLIIVRSRRPSTLFAAVHEPFAGQPFLERTSITPKDSARGAVVAHIRRNGITDHLVHRLDADRAPVSEGLLWMDGDAAFVRERDGVPLTMVLWGGNELRWGEKVLRGCGVFQGDVTETIQSDLGAERNGLVITGDVPEGDALKGSTAIVTFGDGSTCGFPVRAVERTPGGTVLVLQSDPGFSIRNGRAFQACFPRRELPGPVRYRLRTIASVDDAP